MMAEEIKERLSPVSQQRHAARQKARNRGNHGRQHEEAVPPARPEAHKERHAPGTPVSELRQATN